MTDEYRFAGEIAQESELLYQMGEGAAEWRRTELAYEKALNAWHTEADPDSKAMLWVELQTAEAVFKGAESKLRLLADRHIKLVSETEEP